MEETINSDYKRTAAQINLSHIANNIEKMKSLTGNKSKLLAVVKADAYGHGAQHISQTCCDAGVDWLGVATAEEGEALRDNGIMLPILIFGVSLNTSIDCAVKQGLTQTVSDLQTALVISKTAVKLNQTADIHIKLDTGMTRLGFCPDIKNIDIIADICSLPNLSVTGIYSHLATSDSDKDFSLEQMERFNFFCKKLSEIGINIPLRHISNSGSLLDMRNFDLSMTRAGILLYGLPPSSGKKGADELKRLGFKPALTLKSRVAFVKTVDKGVSVGYSRNYFTNKQTKIATVSIGYADGYSRSLSNKAQVLINGSFAKVIGNICMDQLMVDATDIENIAVNDEVVLIGEQKGRQISTEDIAVWQNTINYEVVTGISGRVPRIYI